MIWDGEVKNGIYWNGKIILKSKEKIWKGNIKESYLWNGIGDFEFKDDDNIWICKGKFLNFSVLLFKYL